MDDIPYVVEAINDVLTILERFENMNNDERDFQLLLCKLDYHQRITVNLDIDDFVPRMIGRAYNAMLDMERTNQDTGYTANATGNGRRGRPSFEISREQLSFFIEQGFKVKDISAMLGVSVRTVERRMSLFGLSISGEIDETKITTF